MANRVNVDIDMNVQGYVQGINQAIDSTQKYETETRKIKESTGNFRKEFAQAKKDVLNLANAYSKLSNEAKNSQFGKEMAEQLNEAKEKASQLLDMQTDLNQELRNMASDTIVFDQMAAGMDIFMQSTAAASGVLAQLTGNEEDARRAVVAFTTAQSTLAALTKIQNALQKQSNLMLGVAKVQSLAAAAAEDVRTSSIVGATVAQKAFNAVAKANPYVLLISSILAVTAAYAGFVAMANKSISVQERLKKEMHDASIQGQKDAQSEVVKVNLLYEASQNVSLSLEERKKAVDKLQTQYPAYFGNLTQEEILLGKASEAYKQLTEDIISTAKARAYEKKVQALAESNVDLEDRKRELEKQLKVEKDYANRLANTNTGPGTGGAVAGAVINSSLTERELIKVNKQLSDNKTMMEGYSKAIIKTSDATERLNKATEDTSNSLAAIKKPKVDNGLDTKNTGGTETIKPIINSIGALEKQISDLQEKAKNGVLPEELKDPAKYKAKLKELQTELKDLKIKWGFEEPETKMQELQRKLAEYQKAFILAVDTDDKEAQKAALKAYYETQKAIDDYSVKIKIEPQLSEQQINEQKTKINDIVKDAYKTDNTPVFDFSNLSEQAQKEANKTLEQFNKIGEARKRLNEIMQDTNSSDTQISAAQDGIEKLNISYNELIDTLNRLNDANKQLKETHENINTIGNALNDLGSIMGSIGSMSENKVFNASAILAQAVATYILGWTEATEQAKALGPIGWAAFGLSTFAQALAVVAQIKQAGRFSEGGTVRGNSYYGDKLMAFVNSGETILTQRQTKRVVDALETTDAIVTVEFGELKIKGSDMYVALKNYNGIGSKLGKNIGIR